MTLDKKTLDKKANLASELNLKYALQLNIFNMKSLIKRDKTGSNQRIKMKLLDNFTGYPQIELDALIDKSLLIKLLTKWEDELKKESKTLLKQLKEED